MKLGEFDALCEDQWSRGKRDIISLHLTDAGYKELRDDILVNPDGAHTSKVLKVQEGVPFDPPLRNPVTASDVSYRGGASVGIMEVLWGQKLWPEAIIIDQDAVEADVPLYFPVDITAAAKTASAIHKLIYGQTSHKTNAGYGHIDWTVYPTGNVVAGEGWGAVIADGMILGFKKITETVRCGDCKKPYRLCNCTGGPYPEMQWPLTRR